MSSGNRCQCAESRKPLAERGWRVTQRRCNHSSFNGNRYTPSRYSAIVCTGCHSTWRTTASYVMMLPDYAR